MATTNVESWAVDLSTLGPIYPFVGTEVLLVILGFAFWIVWHIWQMRFEDKTYSEDMEKLSTPEQIERAMRERRLK